MNRAAAVVAFLSVQVCNARDSSLFHERYLIIVLSPFLQTCVAFNCSDISLRFDDCDDNATAAYEWEVEQCMSSVPLCFYAAEYGSLRYASDDRVLASRVGDCSVQPGDPTKTYLTICAFRGITARPQPGPPDTGNCSGMHISNSSISSAADKCDSGSQLATSEEVSSCLHTLCTDWLPAFGQAGYADPDMMVVGSGYTGTCGVLARQGNTVVDFVCVPGPAPPTPSPDTPSPSPTSRYCSVVHISPEFTCGFGTVLASSDIVLQCLPEICAEMDPLAKAKYADQGMMVVGRGYDSACGPQPADNYVGNVLCVPGLEPLSTPSPEHGCANTLCISGTVWMVVAFVLLLIVLSTTGWYLCSRYSCQRRPTPAAAEGTARFEKATQEQQEHPQDKTLASVSENTTLLH